MYVDSEGRSERAIEGFISVAHFLNEPRLARLYAYVLRREDVTIDEIVDEIGMPRTTAYSDAASLADLGMFTRDVTQKTHTYTATPVVLTTTLDEDEYTITPTLIEVIGRIPRDRDLSLLTKPPLSVA